MADGQNFQNRYKVAFHSKLRKLIRFWWNLVCWNSLGRCPILIISLFRMLNIIATTMNIMWPEIRILFVGYRSDNFIVGLTNNDPRNRAPVRGNYTLCGQYPGAVPDGATVSVHCTNVYNRRLRFRYVIVQFPLINDQMNVCEIEVFILGRCANNCLSAISSICERWHNTLMNKYFKINVQDFQNVNFKPQLLGYFVTNDDNQEILCEILYVSLNNINTLTLYRHFQWHWYFKWHFSLYILAIFRLFSNFFLIYC